VRFTKLALLVFAHVLFGTSLPGAEPPRVATTVGMPAKIEQLVLPAPSLRRGRSRIVAHRSSFES
jgi:hypothetical protein